MNPAFFSTSLGTAGTAAVLALNPTGLVALEPYTRAAAWALLAVAAALFGILVVMALLPRRLNWAEMGSPVAGPAFATIPAAMMVIIAAVISLEPQSVAGGFWWWSGLLWNTVGAALAVVVTIRLFVAAFAHDAFPVERMSGVWFIPETALLLSGMVAGRLAVTGPPRWIDGLVVVAFALVGAGLSLFALTAAVFFTRLIVHAHVRETGAPAMWIMLSPLSIGALALHQVGADAALLDQRLGSGVEPVTNLLALLLWGFSLWWLLAAVVISWSARAAAFTHTPADWGYVFPPAAMTLATVTLGRVWDSPAMQALGTVFAGFLLVTWVTVSVGTFRYARGSG